MTMIDGNTSAEIMHARAEGDEHAPEFTTAELAALREDAERYRGLVALLTTAHAGFLSVNEHRLSYGDAPAEGPFCIQWYPNTPVGFNIVQAETLDAAIKQARKEGA
jgi:hypothetical protein